MNQATTALLDIKLAHRWPVARGLKPAQHQLGGITALVDGGGGGGAAATHVDCITQHHGASTLVDGDAGLHIKVAIHAHRTTCLSHSETAAAAQAGHAVPTATDSLHVGRVSECQGTTADGEAFLDVGLLGARRIAVTTSAVRRAGRNRTAAHGQILGDNLGCGETATRHINRLHCLQAGIRTGTLILAAQHNLARTLQGETARNLQATRDACIRFTSIRRNKTPGIIKGSNLIHITLSPCGITHNHIARPCIGRILHTHVQV